MVDMPEVFNAEPYSLEQIALRLYYDLYRLQELEIPESQARTALGRQQLAVNTADRFAELTGWVIQPQVFEQAMLQNYGQLTASYVADTSTPEDIANIRAQMKAAGYPEADTADSKTLIGRFLDTVDKNDASQKPLLDRLAGTSVQWDKYMPIANYATGPQDKAVRHNVNADFRTAYDRDLTEEEWSGFKQKAQKGELASQPRPWNRWASGLSWNQGMQSGASGGSAIPTFAGANIAANPRTLAQSLGNLGMNTAGANSVISGAPMAGQIPTIEMQRLNQNPQAIAQSLMMAGYTREQVDDIFRQTPAYAELTGQQFNEPGGTLPYNPGPALQPPGGTTWPDRNRNAPSIGQPDATPPFRALPYNPPGATLPYDPRQRLRQADGTIGPVVPDQLLGQPGATLPYNPGPAVGQPGGSIGPVGPGQRLGQPGANPLLPLAGGQMRGRYMNARQRLNDLRYNPDAMKSITGMASFYGTSPESLLGDFYKMLPKGQVSRPTRFM